jgi:hypothetical protein
MRLATPNLGETSAARNRARFLLDYTNKDVAWGFSRAIMTPHAGLHNLEQQTIRKVIGSRPRQSLPGDA